MIFHNKIKGRPFPKECAKCNQRFFPKTHSTTLCDKCYQEVQREKNVKNKLKRSEWTF